MVVVPISRYDRFEDPSGAIHAYGLAKQFIPDLQLVLAVGGTADDPEGRLCACVISFIIRTGLLKWA